jgi:hypothetical protein
MIFINKTEILVAIVNLMNVLLIKYQFIIYKILKTLHKIIVNVNMNCRFLIIEKKHEEQNNI